MSEMTTQTQATVAKQQPQGLAGALEAMRPEIERVLPRHLSGDRITRIVLTEVRKNPKLAQTDPNSFFGALLTAAALGLEPGVNGQAHLVPYGKECQLIIGYQGFVELFWRHFLAKRLTAETVYEHDHFVYDKGLNMRLEHEPKLDGDRGKPIGYYAIAELTTGGINYEFLTVDQVKALRGGKVGTSGGVADPMKWMERKTVLKQVLKLMPKSAELATALRADETVGSMAVGKAIATGDALPELEYTEDSA